MPFDPNLPQAGTDIDAVEMRGQLNGLKALIDAVPTITAAQVDGVTTLPAGDPATVSVQVVGGVLYLIFGIPQGIQGQVGPEGQVGPPGPAFANAVVDAVNTLPEGDNATVSVSYDGSLVHFTFGIPRGTDGATGAPGEVTTAALEAATAAVAAGSSANSNAVNLLGETADISYNQPQMQTLINKVDELLTVLRR